PPLGAHSPRGSRRAGAGRDPAGARRRPAVHVLGRHAAAAPNREGPRHATASRFHGRADGRARRVRAGAAARPPAPPRHGPRAVGGHRHARSRRRAAPGASAAGDERRGGHRVGPDRSGPRRPAAPVHATARLVGAAPRNGAAAPAIRIRELAKAFTLHNQGGVTLPVLRRLSLRVDGGECVVLTDPSGSGKSTLLRAIYGNYKPQAGEILVRHGDRMVDVASAEPRQILEVRRRTMGYVSQFLRVIPRVPAVLVVAEPLRALGVRPAEAIERA